MRKLCFIILMTIAVAACSYEEEVELCDVSVQLIYPENSIDPYKGARVELCARTSSVFVDSTDANGVAHFLVPAGVYNASTSEVFKTYDYRYIFNGVKSLFVVSPDSTNNVSIKLTMTKKRIVH